MIFNVVGDILGSSIEFNHVKPTLGNIDLSELAKNGFVTDDSVMTLATWRWLIDYRRGMTTVDDYIHYLRDFFKLTPTIGYGPMFFKLMAKGELPNPPSCGNGAAMRISPIGFVSLEGDTLESKLELTKQLTLQTHKHPEAVKGAQAVVYAIHRLRVEEEEDKLKVLSEIEARFGYDLHLIYSQLLSDPFDATCQGSVPQALWCALTSETIEEMFKKALTIGGDSDTIACIAGGVFQSSLRGHFPRGKLPMKMEDIENKLTMIHPDLTITYKEAILYPGFGGQLSTMIW